MIDRGHADRAVIRARSEWQLTRVAHLRLCPVGDTGNASVEHEPFWRVVIDSVIARVDVYRSDGHAGPCQQQPNGCPAGARADIDDASDS